MPPQNGQKPMLDLSPQNLEFHNLSHITLTATQSKPLCMGLRFRPTLRPPAVCVFENLIQDVCRITNVPISPRTRILTQNFTCKQDGIRRSKIQTLKKRSLLGFTRKQAMCVKWKESKFSCTAFKFHFIF